MKTVLGVQGFVRLSLVLGGAALVSGMITGYSSRPNRVPINVPKLKWKGTITMYAQTYTPSVPGVKLAPGSPKLSAFENVAKAFEKLYPGIHIRFINPPAMSSNDIQAVEVDAAGGRLPDVLWGQYIDFNTVWPKGIVANLDPYFNQPDPYIPGNKLWKNVMNKRVLAQTVAPSGAHYIVDGDWVGTAFYYNKSLFHQAGISSPPKSWAQIIADAKILKSHHITPGADIPYYSWWSRLFLGNDLGARTVAELEHYSKSKDAVTALGEVIGYKKGIFNPSTNPRIMAWWPLVRQLYRYWNVDVTDIPVLNQPSGVQNGQKLFAAGKVAMVYQGSWMPNEAKVAGAKFAIGSFQFPAGSLSKAFKYGTSINSSADVGGPSAAFQYAIATQRADHSMSPAKFQAVLDWVRFFSTPTMDQKIVNQLGEFVPTFKGAKALKEERGAALPKGAKYASIFGFSDLSAEAHTRIFDLFQEYVSGHLSFAAAKQQYDAVVQQAVQQYIVTNHPRIP